MDSCSIVLCAFNRLEYLKQAITSLLELDFPSYEIIIVNDGSTDGTKNFLDALKNDKIRVIHHERNQGLSASRNTGIKYARFETIAFTDDDCQVDKNYLTNLLKGFTNEQIGFVTGQTFYISRNYKGYFPERLVSNPDARWPMGGNSAYRKEVFETCGDFDDVFFKFNNEDTEMAIRAVSQGFAFNRAPEAITCHQAANWTPQTLLKSAKNAAVWPALKKKYPRHFLYFHPAIKFGFIIHAEDYLFLLTSPVLIPLLLVRYLMHGKRDLKIFFTKWPIYFILRRYYIYKEAVKNKVFMI